MLALDFDGVVADGINECMLTSWATFHDMAMAAFEPETLSSIPSTFSERFRFLRNFVRHDGHFLVSFSEAAGTIGGQEDFNHVYNAFPDDVREGFRKRFVEYRGAVRERYRDYWMLLHHIHEPVMQMISAYNAQIVSGKDADSIAALLNFKGINLPLENIHGRMTDKRATLLGLQQDAPGQLIFCDDNIMNVIEATDLGIQTVWALWGYHTPEHLNIAADKGITGSELNDFVTQIALAA